MKKFYNLGTRACQTVYSLFNYYVFLAQPGLTLCLVGKFAFFFLICFSSELSFLKKKFSVLQVRSR